jgi:hypothetical protein
MGHKAIPGMINKAIKNAIYIVIKLSRSWIKEIYLRFSI